MPGKVDCHGVTNAGRVRETNQDNFIIAELEKSLTIREASISFGERDELTSGQRGQLLAVADGMGGHVGGEQASRLTLYAVSEFMLNTLPWFHQPDAPADEHQSERLVRAIRRCEQRLANDSRQNPEREDMGTTLTMAYVVWPAMRLVHIGDSRCYCFRQGQLRQLTVDHTVAQRLLDSNFAPEDIPERWHHTLWNSVSGSENDAQPSVDYVELEIGDTLLLCTDGLTEHVEDGEIRETLAADLSAEAACEKLVQMANDRGGTDNITIIVARFLDADEVPSDLQAEAECGSFAQTDAELHKPTEFTDDAGSSPPTEVR